MVQGWKRSIRPLTTIAALVGTGFFPTLPSVAQLLPDDSLGAERSVITVGNDPTGQPAELIEGGTRRGGNLFHSFQDFNVGDLQRVYFANPEGVNNILSRVTGSNPSNILGTLGVLGDANLFLINPNGIFFGPNARLDIRGSFIASTANRIRFADGVEFSAVDPAASPLLTVNVPIGLQYGSNPGNLQVQRSNLQVNSGQTLALLGGSVSLEGGRLISPGGQVALIGVAGTDTLDLNWNGIHPSLSVPQSAALADISLTNGSLIDTRDSNGGNITIRAQNLYLSNGSQLLAGILGVGLPDTQARNIAIHAAGTVTVTGNDSRIANEVDWGSVGNAGDINIIAESLTVANGSDIAASTKGQGNAGNLTITTGSLAITHDAYLAASTNGEAGNAGNITLNVRDAALFDDYGRAYTDITRQGQGGDITITAGSLAITDSSQLMTRTTGQGDAGNLTITTNSLLVNNESFLATSANGQGDAGNITLNVRDTASFENGARAYTDVNTPSPDVSIESIRGQGGDITITAGSLAMTSGSQLVASTSSQGDAGNISIATGSLFVNHDSYLAASANGQGDAGNITLNVRDTATFNDFGRAYTDVTTQGQGGNIHITSGSLAVTDGSQLLARTTGQGDAGNITIVTGSLLVTNGSFLATSANGQGDAGNITVDVRDTASFVNGAVYADVNVPWASDAVAQSIRGQGGDITMTAGSLAVTDRSSWATSTRGQGDAGNITIMADSLSVTQESSLAASANGQGNAGNITLNVRDTASFDNSGRAYTDVTTQGQGGDISITAGSLAVTDSSQLTTRTTGQGDAGNLTITTNSLLVNNESFLAASANGEGDAGDITLNVRDTALFENGAKVYTDVNTPAPFNIAAQSIRGQGGDITITAGSLAITNGAQLISNSYGEGDAGNISINTGSLSITNEAFVTASANGEGNGGDIAITASGAVSLMNGSSAFSNVGFCQTDVVGCSTSNNTVTGRGGDISINASSLNLMNGSFLATGVGDDLADRRAQGNAGDISIHLRGALSLDRSYITSRIFTSGIGNGGNIKIQAGAISSSQSLISASTQGRGNAGRISVFSTGSIVLDDSDISTAVQQGAIGNAEGITLRARSLTLRNGSQLNAVTSGQGDAGNIRINASDRVSVTGTNTAIAPTIFNYTPPRFASSPEFVDGVSSGIFTSTNSSGDGGNIKINTSAFSISDGAIVDARTTANGRGGTISVNTNTFAATSGGQLTAITSGSGTAGDIFLEASDDITIAGRDPSYSARLAQFGSQPDIYGKPRVGSIAVERIGAASGLFANTEAFSTGQGGNIRIETATGLFTIQDGAHLVTSSNGSGRAGNIRLSAPDIRLDNQAAIEANTEGGRGNIALQTDTLILRRNSHITTNAEGTATGGNININAAAGFIIAAPNENNDIIANANEGSGGQITLTAQGIFGFDVRNRENLERLLNTTNPNELIPGNLSSNDITAFSQANPAIDTGAVDIRTLALDPTQGLTTLPTDLSDPSQLIATTCPADEGSSFAITGRGGLPEDPRQPLMGQEIWQDERGNGQEEEVREEAEEGIREATIVEAQGWTVDRTGTVILVAQQPQIQQPAAFRQLSCIVRGNNHSP